MMMGRSRSGSCAVHLLQLVGPLLLLQLVRGAAGVSPPRGAGKGVPAPPPTPPKFPRREEGPRLGRLRGAAAPEQGEQQQQLPHLPEELRQSLRGTPVTTTPASEQRQMPPVVVGQQHADAAAAGAGTSGVVKSVEQQPTAPAVGGQRHAAPPQQVEPGFELWKQQVEANVRQELAKETKFINQLMRKQSLAEARQHRLEKALQMLFSHYRTSQARAHQNEVTLHRLSTWAHEAHSQMVSMEKGLDGRVSTLWSSAADAFEAMGVAKDAAEKALDAQEAADQQATVEAESALADDSPSSDPAGGAL